ncbi:MAG: metallophosphoesterase [Micropruina sp.]
MGFPLVRSMLAARQHRPIGLVCLIVIAMTAATLGAAAPAQAATALTIKPGSSAWAKAGPSRLTSIAEVAIKVPANTAGEMGLQFRATAKSSGYRTKIKVAANGVVTGSFSRVQSGKQTAIGTARLLGLHVRSGDTVHLQATVVAKTAVRLYLRAWKAGTARPSAWQMTASDSSSKKIVKAGPTYLWARTPAATPTVGLPYTVVSVAAFSAAKAAAIGVKTSPAKVFSIAVIGDTQNETSSDTDPRFGNRTAWLASNRNSLKLSYVLHTGDVVNWGWLVPKQYVNARTAMAKLTTAGLPWSVAVGNHDTRAVGWNNIPGSTGYGGSAYAYNPDCPIRLSPAECNSSLLVRKTAEFNASFPVSQLANLGGAFEAEKIDNAWTTFTAYDTKWLVLNLEFAPRKSAVEWARQVVAAHPDHNVIIDTHFYLSSKGTISTSNAGYGDTSGKYIYDQIVSKYANVKIVVSGHTGSFASRSDTNKGNKTLSYLGNDLGDSNNPVRILTINTESGKVTNTVYSKVKPGSATSYSTGSNTISVIG